MSALFVEGRSSYSLPVLHDKLGDDDILQLPEPVDAVEALVLGGGVPGGVDQDHPGTRGQVEADAAGAEGKEKNVGRALKKHPSCSIKCIMIRYDPSEKDKFILASSVDWKFATTAARCFVFMVPSSLVQLYLSLVNRG